MNEHIRQRQLLSLLDAQKVLSTQEIVTLLNVSPATARRDIAKLDQQGLLKKVRNGVEVLPTAHKITAVISSRNEKERIAEAAAKLCKPGETVLLTCGSTMMMLGHRLCGQKLQIVTNYLPLATHLIENGHEDLVIMGGQYHRNKAITLSLNTQNDAVHTAQIMFTSGKGLTEEGLFKTDMIIANSEKQMSARSGKYVVLLDSSKLGNRVGMLFRAIDEIDLLITGKEADENIIQALRSKGLEILLA